MSCTGWFARAGKVIPGGVNSPVRAFGAVGGDPLYVSGGEGSSVEAADGRRLLDFCGSWGSLLFGHAHPCIVEAVAAAAARGTSFGINTPMEVEFAERLSGIVPGMEMLRMVSSGTEALMTAIRLARGYTKRDKIVKFAGCYHGHSDSLLAVAGSGLLTGGIASSDGVPEAVVADTIVHEYNDLAAVRETIDKSGDQIAAILVEPMAGNMGLVNPAEVFLEGLRDLTDNCGALLVFDEVISGFRLEASTYGKLCGITPDITTLGKIVGGGLPLAVVGGRSEIMERLAPIGSVYQAGTLSGNPVAVAAGMAMLDLIERDRPYDRIDRLGEKLEQGLHERAASHGVDFTCVRKGGVFTPFFRKGAPANLSEVKQCDLSSFAGYFNHLLRRGIYLSPSQFELNFISAMHTEDEIELLLAASDEAFSAIRR